MSDFKKILAIILMTLFVFCMGWGWGHVWRASIVVHPDKGGGVWNCVYEKGAD